MNQFTGRTRQALEHTGADGGPIQQKRSIEVRFVAPTWAGRAINGLLYWSSKRGDWGSKKQATAYLRKYPDKPMPLAWDPQWVREAVSSLDTQRDEPRAQQIAQETSAVSGIDEQAA